MYRAPNYWADIDNCKAELDTFCEEIGAPKGVVPSVYSMQQAKRYDLSRAVRHWGGLAKLADAVGYEVSCQGFLITLMSAHVHQYLSMICTLEVLGPISSLVQERNVRKVLQTLLVGAK